MGEKSPSHAAAAADSQAAMVLPAWTIRAATLSETKASGRQDDRKHDGGREIRKVLQLPPPNAVAAGEQNTLTTATSGGPPGFVPGTNGL